MSISSAMSSALSGLTVSSRAAEVISSNIANALTEGYARREVQVSVRRVGDAGQGAQVSGVHRDVNGFLMADRRLAGARAADLDLREGFFSRLEGQLGNPQDSASLTGRIATLDAALIAAASRPDNEARLSALADAATGLTAGFRTIADDLQTARSEADSRIAQQVSEVNHALVGIANLNGHIVSFSSGSRDTSALQDQRQQLIDQISTIIPLREVQDSAGRVTLYTGGGAVLLDGRPTELGFAKVGVITPDMTLASGALSGLTLKGRPLRTDATGPLSGGSLGALFAIRDQLAVEAQAGLDAVARDLVDRFQDPALDATRAPGAAGLFTDHGLEFNPVDEVGLSQRLMLNAATVPQSGGALWRLRDGLGSATPGPVGESALLNALHQALAAPRLTLSGGFSPAQRSLPGLAAQLASGVATNRLTAQKDASFSSARAEALRVMELEGGVDTDREMQDLLLIENAYAANAKVIQTMDQMLQLLLGM